MPPFSFRRKACPCPNRKLSENNNLVKIATVDSLQFSTVCERSGMKSVIIKGPVAVVVIYGSVADFNTEAVERRNIPTF